MAGMLALMALAASSTLLLPPPLPLPLPLPLPVPLPSPAGTLSPATKNSDTPVATISPLTSSPGPLISLVKRWIPLGSSSSASNSTSTRLKSAINIKELFEAFAKWACNADKTSEGWCISEAPSIPAQEVAVLTAPSFFSF